MDHRWNTSIRQWVALGILAVLLLSLRILWPFLTPLSLSLLLTYIMIPLVDLVQRRTSWPRTAAAGFVYLLLIVGIALVPALVIPVIVDQLQSLVPPLVRAIDQLGDLIRNLGTMTILGQPVDPFVLYEQLSSELIALSTRIASSSVDLLFGFATTFVSTILWLLFILVISFYIVRDSPNIARYFWSLIPRANRVEIYYLTRRIDRTWNAFLNGQIVLSLVIFALTTLTLLALGVPQAVFLGFIAGLLNLIPNLGPILAAIPAIALALVQGSTHFEISNLVFALMVAFAYVIIQQLESNILVPRIIGGSVHLHPAVVIVGALIGLSIVGLLGIFLAAPTLGSLRVIGGYAYRKLLDPDYTPPAIVVPLEIVAIPDPSERAPVPIPSPSGGFVGRPRLLWRQWTARRLAHRTATPVASPSEERQDA